MSINSIIAIICIIVAVWFGFKGYLETRINTPYSVEKVYNMLYNNFIYKFLIFFCKY